MDMDVFDAVFKAGRKAIGALLFVLLAVSLFIGALLFKAWNDVRQANNHKADARRDFELEAVQRGHGVWRINSEGVVYFDWKEAQ